MCRLVGRQCTVEELLARESIETKSHRFDNGAGEADVQPMPLNGDTSRRRHGGDTLDARGLQDVEQTAIYVYLTIAILVVGIAERRVGMAAGAGYYIQDVSRGKARVGL